MKPKIPASRIKSDECAINIGQVIEDGEIVNPGTPDEEIMPSSARLHLKAGNIFSVQPPGGGGYGDPAKRDPDALTNDISEGFVSADAAARDYG